MSNADQKPLETVSSAANCLPTGDKWQSETVTTDFLFMFVDSINVFDCRCVAKNGGNQDNLLTEQMVDTFFETTRRQIESQLVNIL